MDEILDKISHVKISDKSLIWNTDLLETIELENLIQQAVVTVSQLKIEKKAEGLLQEMILEIEMMKIGYFTH